MKVWPVGTAHGGEFTVSAASIDLVYRFVPYRSGEKLRPVAKPIAEPDRRHRSVDGQVLRLDERSCALGFWRRQRERRSQSHAHVRQTRYLHVSLTVTDAAGGGARNQLLIFVDRKSSEPIVRAGFAHRRNTCPGIARARQRASPTDRSICQTVNRLDGSKPVTNRWRTYAGCGPSRFVGWLKPESLKVGSGGNRIVYCLQKDRSGIDLVHLADGRLRLSVNEWPDRVNNDSSPGKLVVGKWTFFAVSYDVAKASDNVAWYFSSPVSAPRDDVRHQARSCDDLQRGTGRRRYCTVGDRQFQRNDARLRT